MKKQKLNQKNEFKVFMTLPIDMKQYQWNFDQLDALTSCNNVL